MNDRNFREMLEAKWASGKFVCVGLDSDIKKIPESVRTGGNEDPVSDANTMVAFNQAIVEATRDLVCAYKPNAAFYRGQGDKGLAALQRTIADIHAIVPDVPVIVDAKIADIDNTNAGYVEEVFGYLRADAVTVHPFLGSEALGPFLAMEDKGIIVLCRTSNKGAGEFQDLEVRVGTAENGQPLVRPFYQVVADNVATKWNTRGNCAVVAGATFPHELRWIRKIVGDMPILIPAIGFQQKDVPLEAQVEQVVGAGKDSRGRGMIINSARGIIFASNGPDFAAAARRETEKLHGLITAALAKAA